ncbi:unnamed protein product, partial [Chrysoparadoxa australica]
RRQTRLPVAYLSYDFRKHPMGQLTAGLICTQQSSHRIRPIVASYGLDDGSPLRDRISTCTSDFLELAGLPDLEAAAALQHAGPHIMVDLMGHTTGTRLGIPSLRPAPINVNYLGYPGTTGASYMNYALVDKTVVPPDSSGSFSEHLVYLPHSYQANEYSLEASFCGGRQSSSKALLQCQKEVREKQDLGLSLSDGPVLCNYNLLDKLEPEAFGVMMQLLMELPHASLVLLSLGQDEEVKRAQQESIRGEAAARGVHPSRVVFDARLNRADHLKRLSGVCDVFIDSFVYGAHTTAADALWGGLPLITLEGYGFDTNPIGKMQGRVGASMLKTLGLHTLAFNGLKQLQEATVHLLGRPDWRKSCQLLRARVLEGAMGGALFDTRLISSHTEAAYEAMWEVREAQVYEGTDMHIKVGPPGMPNLLSQAFDLYIDLVTSKEEYCFSLQDPALHAVPRPGLPPSCSSSKCWLTPWVVQGSDDKAEAVINRALARDATNWNALQLHGAGLLNDKHKPEASVAHEEAILVRHLQALVTLFERFWPGLDEARQVVSSEVKLPLRELGVHGRVKTKSYIIGQGKKPSFELPPRAGKQQVLDWDGLCWHRVCHGSQQTHVNAQPDHHPKHRAHFLSLLPLSLSLHSPLQVRHGIVFCRYVVASYACLRSHTLTPALPVLPGDAEASHVHVTAAVRDQHAMDFSAYEASPAIGRIPRPKHATVVAIYCHEYGQSWFKQWGPSSLKKGKGLGGSEEAVVFITRELVKLGHWVEVYADPPESDFGMDESGVVWYPYAAYDIASPPHVFVAWRYHISLALAGASGSVFLWMQDLPLFQDFSSWVDRLDGVFCLSTFHAQMLPGGLLDLAIITPNGIDPLFLTEGQNLPRQFIYSSAPARGLMTVLTAWPTILEALPGATLEVYYGFTQSFIDHGRKSVLNFDEWMAKTKALLEQPGVNYHGMVDHATLAKALADAAFILYPTSFPETGCITLMKAMCMGAIPITSRFEASTLPELTTVWDMGPPEPVPTTNTYELPPEPWVEAWTRLDLRVRSRSSSGSIRTQSPKSKEL